MTVHTLITNETPQPLCEPHQDPSCKPPVLPKKVSMQQTLTTSVLDSSSLKAEIVWALKSVMSGYSNNSSSDMNVTFQKMFPDSNIAKQYQMGPDKLKYIVNWGLAPYFKDLLIEDISKAKYLSVGFDESLNKITQSCQMDLMVRYWDVNNSKVQVRYWDSTFLGHSAANDLLQHFNDSVESINPSKIIHVSMDGPTVNHKFYKGLEDHREREELPKMINIGSCNLHIVHGAFKSGFESTDWGMKKLLKGCYQILHDSPARRADYITITKSNKFPLAFCSTRWIEDRPVADRLLEIWPEIVKVVKYWNSLPKSKQPKCKTFITLVNAVNDQLTPLKLSFFSYFASLLHPFLVKYQSEKPLIPYLYDDLTKCLKNILRVIVKEETLGCQGKDLSKIDLNKSCNLKSKKDYHLGLATEAMLKELRKKDDIELKDIRNFYEMVTLCVGKTATKLLERSPINSVVVRTVRVFNPSLIIPENKGALLKMMKPLLKHLHMLKVITVRIGDKAYDQYSDFIDQKSNCIVLDNVDRLDELFFQSLEISKFPELSQVAMIIFTISNGQADVERGFSTNAQVIDVNMKVNSMKSQRLVRDHMKKHGQKPSTISIPTKLKKSYQAAHQRYQCYLEEEKKKESSKKVNTVKQLLDSEIYEIKQKINALVKSSTSLDKKFVELVRDAEKSKDATLMISEANGLKRKSEEQVSEREKLEETLNLVKEKRSKI